MCIRDSRIETRRFEVRFQDGASPAFRITHDVAAVPPQDPRSQPRVGQPEYALSLIHI